MRVPQYLDALWNMEHLNMARIKIGGNPPDLDTSIWWMDESCQYDQVFHIIWYWYGFFSCHGTKKKALDPSLCKSKFFVAFQWEQCLLNHGDGYWVLFEILRNLLFSNIVSVRTIHEVFKGIPRYLYILCIYIYIYIITIHVCI